MCLSIIEAQMRSVFVTVFLQIDILLDGSANTCFRARERDAVSLLSPAQSNYFVKQGTNQSGRI